MLSLEQEKDFEEQFRGSGFLLEHEVCEALRAKEWSVISNRRYLDDVESSVREVDAIAYNTTIKPDCTVCTALIIIGDLGAAAEPLAAGTVA